MVITSRLKWVLALGDARTVDTDETRGRNPETALGPAIQARLDSIEADHTRRAMRTALEAFASYLRRERGVDDLAELSVVDCRRFAQHLRERSRLPEDDADHLSAATANQYYARVRASCTWWVEDERLATNVAKPRRATAELPEDTSEPERQTWTPEQRELLLRHTDDVVDETLDALADGDDDTTEDDELRVFRDRALAYVLAWTGARGAEVLRDPADDERDGLTWGDVDPDGTLALLGKTRTRERAPLPEPVRRRLVRWRTVLSPPDDDWPVFPQLSKGHLSRTLAAATGEEPGYDSDASVRERLDAFAGRGVAPPAISTNAGRNVMQRLTEAADLEVEGGYLKPHGGRRALGDTLWEVEDPAAAQDALRHRSPETTQEAYREKQQADLAGQIDDAISGDE